MRARWLTAMALGAGLFLSTPMTAKAAPILDGGTLAASASERLLLLDVKGWKGNRGRHNGWNRGRKNGWYKNGRGRGPRMGIYF